MHIHNTSYSITPAGQNSLIISHMFYTFIIFSCTLHPFPLKIYPFFMRVGRSSGYYFTFKLIIISFLKLFILIAVVVSVQSGVSLIINRHRGHHCLLYFIVRGFKDTRVCPLTPHWQKTTRPLGDERWMEISCRASGDLILNRCSCFSLALVGWDHNLTLHLKACQICQVNWW